MHTIWKGTISFGLVSIPVKLHAATENKDIRLRQLHDKCNAPVKYEKVCTKCGEEVGRDEMVKAYEYSDNKFIVLDDEELEKIKKEQEEKAVEILDFVKLEDIDPVYFDKTYYISPNEGGSKAYALLRQALGETNKIGVAKISIRSKERLAAIRVYGDSITMETLHFPDEVRAVKDIPNLPVETKVSKKELDTAKVLIDQLTAAFDPKIYTDDYRVALAELIEEKVKDEKGVKVEESNNVIDLMSALEASLDKGKKKTKKKATTKAKKAKAK